MTTAKEKLRDLMHNISQRCYCASWIVDCQYDLWTMVLGGSRDWGGYGPVTEEEVSELKRLSEECGGWWTMRHFLPMSIWLPLYACKAPELERRRNGGAT